MTFSKIALVTAATALLSAPAFAQAPAASVDIPQTHSSSVTPTSGLPASGTPMKSSGTMMKSDTALKRSAPGVSDTKTTATGGQPGGIPGRAQ